MRPAADAEAVIAWLAEMWNRREIFVLGAWERANGEYAGEASLISQRVAAHLGFTWKAGSEPVTASRKSRWLTGCGIGWLKSQPKQIPGREQMTWKIALREKHAREDH